MLFEREILPPKGRIEVLTRLFHETARKDGEGPQPGHVPVPVLEAHGDFNTHVRYIIEAAEKQCKDKERLRLMRKISRLLDVLPEVIMMALTIGPEGRWLRFYRILAEIHGMLEDAELGLEADEYTAISRKLIHLAGAVADASVLRVDGASTFALLLTQLLLHKHSSKRKKAKPVRKKKK